MLGNPTATVTSPMVFKFSKLYSKSRALMFQFMCGVCSPRNVNVKSAGASSYPRGATPVTFSVTTTVAVPSDGNNVPAVKASINSMFPTSDTNTMSYVDPVDKLTDTSPMVVKAFSAVSMAAALASYANATVASLRQDNMKVPDEAPAMVKVCVSLRAGSTNISTV